MTCPQKKATFREIDPPYFADFQAVVHFGIRELIYQLGELFSGSVL